MVITFDVKAKRENCMNGASGEKGNERSASIVGERKLTVNSTCITENNQRGNAGGDCDSSSWGKRGPGKEN